MSQFQYGVGPPDTIVMRSNDDRIMFEEYNDACWIVDSVLQVCQFATIVSNSTLWGRSKLLGMNGATDDANTAFTPWDYYWFELLIKARGNRCRLLITGFIRDSLGNPIAGAIVKVFRTVDDLFIRQVTSDGDGRYNLYVDTNEAYYCVAYRAGAPDIAGTTANTLVGA